MLLEADVGFLFRAPPNVRREFPQFRGVEDHAEFLAAIREVL
jgi:hypothetical protein